MPTAIYQTGKGTVPALTAGLTIDNILLGSQWMYLPGPTEVYFGIVGNGTLGDVLATISSGTDMLAEEQPISIANRFPVWPDDFMYNDVAAAGDLLKVRLRNTSAGTLAVTLVLRLNQL